MLGQQQMMPPFRYPLGASPYRGSRPPQHLWHPRLHGKCSCGVLVDIPDQVPHAKPRCRHDKLRVVNKHHVMVVSEKPHDGTRYASGADATPAG
jgi:hypothetical protein